jgi:ribosomal protein S18 acetylase RimI-like enzyme
MPVLGPSCVGVRVVVRRLVPGETGPTGGPAMTDLLGVLESWGEHTIVVRPADGEAVEIDRRLIVSGKPVPPRPSVRSRLSADDVALRAASSWPALEVERLGEWLLRASAGFSRRANSALVAGDPGLPLEGAFEQVRAFYRSRQLEPRLQVGTGSPAAATATALGWVPDGSVLDVEVQLAGVSQALRGARARMPVPAAQVRLTSTATEGWLADDPRAREYGDVAIAVLQGPDDVVFAAVEDEAGTVVAKGRAALSTRADVWVGLTDLWVAPSHRRQGLARAVVAALLGWSAERGATTAYLQATSDNEAALRLYGELGFVTHHRYRYLTLPHEGPDAATLRRPDTAAGEGA